MCLSVFKVSCYSQDSMSIFDLMHFCEMSALCFMSRYVNTICHTKQNIVCMCVYLYQIFVPRNITLNIMCMIMCCCFCNLLIFLIQSVALDRCYFLLQIRVWQFNVRPLEVAVTPKSFDFLRRGSNLHFVRRKTEHRHRAGEGCCARTYHLKTVWSAKCVSGRGTSRTPPFNFDCV